MGIAKPIEEYERDILQSLGLEYRGLKWCELGNQRNEENKVAKDIYLSLGVEHISIDLNAEDGALPIDLDKPVPFIFLKQFDVITNYGTIEHVNNQFQAFKNIHDMNKQGGIAIHVLPLAGNWPKHCRYYYSEEFARNLADVCGYQIINYKILNESVYKSPNNLIAVTFIKNQNDNFIAKEEFSRIKGVKDTGDFAYTGNYTGKNKNIIIRILKRLKAMILK